MDNSSEDINTAEAEVKRRLFGQRTEAANWCINGLNLFLRGFDDLRSAAPNSDAERVQFVLLGRAWNTLYCAFDLASRGYYAQSLNLLRTPVEDWLAYWYLQSFPRKSRLFIDPNLNSPRFDSMLQQLENKHGAVVQKQLVDAWIGRLHKFSHVDHAGIQIAFQASDSGLQLNLGPTHDPDLFLYVAAEVVTELRVFLDALNNFRQVAGQSPMAESANYQRDSRAWLSQVAATTPDQEDASQESGNV